MKSSTLMLYMIVLMLMVYIMQSQYPRRLLTAITIIAILPFAFIIDKSKYYAAVIKMHICFGLAYIELRKVSKRLKLYGEVLNGLNLCVKDATLIESESLVLYKRRAELDKEVTT